MSRTPVPVALRRRVAVQAQHRCGYCLTPEELTGAAMEVEHIIPEALGGQTVEENLWLGCRRCNGCKGQRTHAADPLTGEPVPLLNPRMQRWEDHFAWSQDGTRIIGQTPTGRATIQALWMNDDLIVKAHERWVKGGWWPPMG
jgi:5-methylcytosine-specific restriction endonuclease McrA